MHVCMVIAVPGEGVAACGCARVHAVACCSDWWCVHLHPCRGVVVVTMMMVQMVRVYSRWAGNERVGGQEVVLHETVQLWPPLVG